jgi:transcriptional regulator with GAF, ATPase, and Fis domain
MGQTIVDSLSSHIAVLSPDGVIEQVNRAWRDFAAHNGLSDDLVGTNYLSVCDAALGENSGEARLAAKGIREVILRKRDLFSLEYPCHSPNEQRWFDLRVTRFQGEGPERIVVSHENITARKLAEDALRLSHDKLEAYVQERTCQLRTVNDALAREVEERKRAEISLQRALAEITRLEDRLARENVYLREEIQQEHNFEEMVGESEELKYVFYRIEQIAPTDTTVLILGETGTGKELVARAIHNAGKRRERPLVKVNCAVLPSNLIESELFGHEKGAYTGAERRRVGRFELADGSTLFLDEIGELPLELQAKLLRVLQDGEFERLGSSETIKVDTRIIAATNRNLRQEVKRGRFREDLWYRLDVFPITVPPLRQRRMDIPLLVKHFVNRFSKKHSKEIDSIPKGTLDRLMRYSWPGNVRELENVLERAVIVSTERTLRVVVPSDAPGSEPVDGRSLESIERDHIVNVLRTAKWKIEGSTGAAAALGLNASTLRSRMKKLGIARPKTGDEIPFRSP